MMQGFYHGNSYKIMRDVGQCVAGQRVFPKSGVLYDSKGRMLSPAEAKESIEVMLTPVDPTVDRIIEQCIELKRYL